MFSLLKEDGIIVSQRHMKEPVEDIIGLDNFRTEKYGDTTVAFYRLSIWETILLK